MKKLEFLYTKHAFCFGSEIFQLSLTQPFHFSAGAHAARIAKAAVQPLANNVASAAAPPAGNEPATPMPPMNFHFLNPQGVLAQAKVPSPTIPNIPIPPKKDANERRNSSPPASDFKVPSPSGTGNYVIFGKLLILFTNSWVEEPISPVRQSCSGEQSTLSQDALP